MYLFSLGSESPKGAIGHIVPTEKTILAVETNKMLLPPHWSRTFSWGFDDYSCCLGNYGSDKASGAGMQGGPRDSACLLLVGAEVVRRPASPKQPQLPTPPLPPHACAPSLGMRGFEQPCQEPGRLSLPPCYQESNL